MASPAEVIAAKYEELTQRRFQDGGLDKGLDGFSMPERTIWLIVTLRCVIDMDGFPSVFEQTFTRPELEETTVCLRALGLSRSADLLQQALALLDEHGVYAQGGDPQQVAIIIPEAVQGPLDEIGAQIVEGDVLWGVDPALVTLLENS